MLEILPKYSSFEELSSNPPSTFNAMLDTSAGNLLQRSVKAWITPRNPEGTIKLIEAMRVDVFQRALLRCHNRWLVPKSWKEKPGDNYTMPDGSLNSMVDFAMNKTSFNEAIHSVGVVAASALLLSLIAEGRTDYPVVFSVGALMEDIYCILAQRYTRARLSIAIDRALARNERFNVDEYRNVLRVKMPEVSSTSRVE